MPEFDDMDGATLQRVLHLVRAHTGIHMVEGKRTMLQARLRPQMRKLNVASYAEYVERLSEDASVLQPFIDAVTTHQTSFFRTPKVWHYFREVFLPRWVAQGHRRPLSVWSAAASTGEEACSIAMCCEDMRRQRPEFSYDIVATDISAEVLTHAQAGVYSGTSVAAFQAADPALFERHNAAKSPGVFTLPAAMRNRMSFQVHNLLSCSPWQDRFDVVFLRNVLIYFNAEDTLRIVRQMAPALRAGGELVIGESESLTALDVPFQYVQPQVYQQVRG